MRPRAPSFIKPQAGKLNANAPVLGRMGTLETRLARSAREIRAAQTLRYDVFYRELCAKPDAITRTRQRDKDRYDSHCDHLLVIDRSLPGAQQIVGTYRLMDEAAAQAAGSYYSQSEFDLAPLFSQHRNKRFLELGRSCIAEPYRSRRTIELMWQGIWAIVLERKIDALFGCASLQGIDPEDHKQGLVWLRDNAALNKSSDCPAVAPTRFSFSSIDGKPNNSARSFASLPPLLKGYLRVGAKVASSAAIDRQFGTIDVLVVLDVAEINDKYIAHYGADASRFAA